MGGQDSNTTADNKEMWAPENLRAIAERRGEFVDLPVHVNRALSAFERFRGHTEEELEAPDLEKLEAAFLNLPVTEIKPDLVKKVPQLGDLRDYLREHGPSREAASPQQSRTAGKHVRASEEPEPDREDDRDNDGM